MSLSHSYSNKYSVPMFIQYTKNVYPMSIYWFRWNNWSNIWKCGYKKNKLSSRYNCYLFLSLLSTGEHVSSTIERIARWFLQKTGGAANAWPLVSFFLSFVSLFHFCISLGIFTVGFDSLVTLILFGLNFQWLLLLHWVRINVCSIFQ